MPARIRSKSQPTVAREGFLDRRSKRCFWLLLSPQTKVARAGARNYPRRRQIMRLRRCAATPHPSRLRRATFPSRGRLNAAAGRGRFTPLRGDTSSAPFGGTCLPAGRSVRGSDTPPACHSTPRTPQGEGLRVRHSHRGPLKGKVDGGVSFNTANPSRGNAWGCGIQHRELIKGEG